jgi:LPXTG-site transpeptidase (sortase) family protein
MIRKFSFLTIVLVVLSILFAASTFPAQADHDWGYIKISPETGHWNFPGYYVLEAERAVTVSWIIKCTYGGCDRPDEDETTYTFEEGEIIQVGWGRQCYAWQFDPIGRTGFIAEAEPWLCTDETPPPSVPPTATPAEPTGTPVTPTQPAETPVGTPTTPPDEPTPTITPGGPTLTPTTPPDEPTPTITPGGPTLTPTTPPDEPTPTITPGGLTLTPTATQDGPVGSPTPEGPVASPTPTSTMTTPQAPEPTPAGPSESESSGGGVILPVTGEVPPASPLSSPLWPALAALLLLSLAGRMVWTGILQSEHVQIPVDLYPGLRAQARKALILILLSLLIFAFLVLPPIIRQAALDFGEPMSSSLPVPALVQELPPNFLSAPSGQEPPLEIQAVPQAQDNQLAALSQPLSPVEKNVSARNTQPLFPSEMNAPALASAGATPVDNRTDTSPINRLVIPALEVDSMVHFIPFEDRTWDIQGLGLDIAWLGDTSSPGLGSNTVLAGHITVLYLGNGPFRYLYRLKPGDLVYVYTDWNVYTYSIREQKVVRENDSSVVGPTDRSQVTLLTCTGWDEEALQYTDRRAVFADLVDTSSLVINQTDDGSEWE